MSENLDLNQIVKMSTAGEGVNIPVEAEKPTTPEDDVEARMNAAMQNNAFTPVQEDTLNVDQTRGLSKDDSKEAIVETINNMATDWNESSEVRKELQTAGVNAHLTGKSEDAKKAEIAAKEEEEKLTEEQEIEKFKKEYADNMLVINKMGDGYLQFSDEEKEKIQKVEVIRLNEVQTVDINSIQTRKKKKYSADKLISMTKATHTFEVPLPVSGFIVALRGLSTQELQNLWVEQDEDVVRRESNKWRILYDCVVNTSIGKLTFSEFMKEVASTDYETLVFGALCATYPNDDNIEINCVNNECGKAYDLKYSLRSLIRAEKFTDDMKDMLAKVIESSTNRENALAVHEESPLKTNDSFILPESGYLIKTYIQNAEEFIEVSLKQLSEVEDPAFAQAAILTSAVQAVLIRDPEDPEFWIENTETEDIIKFIYSLRDRDLSILTKKIEEKIGDRAIKYGFMNVTCPHCGHYSKSLAAPLSEILFHHSQRYQEIEVK